MRERGWGVSEHWHGASIGAGEFSGMRVRAVSKDKYQPLCLAGDGGAWETEPERTQG